MLLICSHIGGGGSPTHILMVAGAFNNICDMSTMACDKFIYLVFPVVSFRFKCLSFPRLIFTDSAGQTSLAFVKAFHF